MTTHRRKRRPCPAAVMVAELQTEIRRLTASDDPADRVLLAMLRGQLDELF
jgi:hypothetical protein